METSNKISSVNIKNNSWQIYFSFHFILKNVQKDSLVRPEITLFQYVVIPCLKTFTWLERNFRVNNDESSSRERMKNVKRVNSYKTVTILLHRYEECPRNSILKPAVTSVAAEMCRIYYGIKLILFIKQFWKWPFFYSNRKIKCYFWIKNQ